MDCNCTENMEHSQKIEEYSWEEDIPNLTIYDVYECTTCGSQEKVDVTAEWICENPL